MSELEKYIHLFNLCLLKEIAKVCASNGGTVLMKEIESFENEVDVFRSTISVDIFLKCQKLDEQKLPENYEELTVVMEGRPADFQESPDGKPVDPDRRGGQVGAWLPGRSCLCLAGAP